MPLVNLGGTSQAVKAGNHWSNYSAFLTLGGRGLDTALTYTDPINLQIARAIKAHPEIDRSELFVVTKVPCCSKHGSVGFSAGFCQNSEYNGTIHADILRNNELLGLKTTDVTLLHHPCLTDEETIEKYLELQAALAAGITKAIGVSNFNAALLDKLLRDPRVKTVPAVNQCNHAIGNHNESHSPGSGGDDKTVKFCKEHGISYSAYSPLEGLSGRYVFDIPEVKAIAKVHNVSGAQVALKWIIQQNISVVTAANNPEYIEEDIDLFDFDLTQEEMRALSSI